jgi:hypothetical protein
VVQLDRWRAIVVLPHRHTARDAAAAEQTSWRAKTVCALILSTRPRDNKRTLRKAESKWRWRLEAEEGVVGGSASALFWAASHAKNSAGNRADAWLREAMCEPLRQMIINYHASEEASERIMEWVKQSDRPWRSFVIDTDTIKLSQEPERHYQQVIDTKPPIVLDDGFRLGLVTPIPQMRRMIEQAAQVAWQMAMVYLIHGDDQKRHSDVAASVGQNA